MSRKWLILLPLQPRRDQVRRLLRSLVLGQDRDQVRNCSSRSLHGLCQLHCVCLCSFWFTESVGSVSCSRVCCNSFICLLIWYSDVWRTEGRCKKMELTRKDKWTELKCMVILVQCRRMVKPKRTNRFRSCYVFAPAKIHILDCIVGVFRYQLIHQLINFSYLSENEVGLLFGVRGHYEIDHLHVPVSSSKPLVVCTT